MPFQVTNHTPIIRPAPIIPPIPEIPNALPAPRVLVLNPAPRRRQPNTSANKTTRSSPNKGGHIRATVRKYVSTGTPLANGKTRYT